MQFAFLPCDFSILAAVAAIGTRDVCIDFDHGKMMTVVVAQ